MVLLTHHAAYGNLSWAQVAKTATELSGRLMRTATFETPILLVSLN